MPTEIIIVDNGSTDQTKRVVSEFSALPLIYSVEPTIGRGFARNCGIKQARYELLLFTDDDCQLPTHWTQVMVELHQKNPLVYAIYGQSKFYGDNANLVMVAQKLQDKFNSDNLYQKKFSHSFDTANLSIKKFFFEKYGLFKPTLHATQDVELARRIEPKLNAILYESTIVVDHLARTQLTQLLTQYFTRGFYLVKWRHQTFFEICCFPLYLRRLLKEQSVQSFIATWYLFLTLLTFNLGTLVGRLIPTR